MPSPTAGSAPTTHKLDKINLLFYSSGLAFILMIPIWLYYDLYPLLNRWSAGSVVATNRHVAPGGHSVTWYFFANGTVHFLQNIIAFALLAITSPVTYSIASLIKRIAVICIAIVWFAQPIHPVQGFGICLTFVGLWMYNRAKGDVERGEKIARKVEARHDLVLPTTKEEAMPLNESSKPQPYPTKAIPSTVQHRNPSLHPTHVRTHSRDNPPAPLNTTLASRSYAHKYVFSPPTNVDIDAQSVMVDPYPSPPKSLDSPPPGLDDLIPSVTISNSNDASLGHSIHNRRTTVQSQAQLPVSVH